MYCSQIIRTSRTSWRPVAFNLTGSRPYTTIPPGQSAPNPKNKRADNTLIYTTLGLAAAAGAYYYFRNTDEAQELKDGAKTGQAQVKSKLDQSKTGIKETLDSAQSTAKEAETRAREVVADLEKSAKERADNIYNEAEQKVASAQKQAKNGWLGWGKSKEEKKDV